MSDFSENSNEPDVPDVSDVADVPDVPDVDLVAVSQAARALPVKPTQAKVLGIVIPVILVVLLGAFLALYFTVLHKHAPSTMAQGNLVPAVPLEPIHTDPVVPTPPKVLPCEGLLVAWSPVVSAWTENNTEPRKSAVELALPQPVSSTYDAGNKAAWILCTANLNTKLMWLRVAGDACLTPLSSTSALPLVTPPDLTVVTPASQWVGTSTFVVYDVALSPWLAPDQPQVAAVSMAPSDTPLSPRRVDLYTYSRSRALWVYEQSLEHPFEPGGAPQTFQTLFGTRLKWIVDGTGQADQLALWIAGTEWTEAFPGGALFWYTVNTNQGVLADAGANDSALASVTLQQTIQDDLLVEEASSTVDRTQAPWYRFNFGSAFDVVMPSAGGALLVIGNPSNAWASSVDGYVQLYLYDLATSLWVRKRAGESNHAPRRLWSFSTTATWGLGAVVQFDPFASTIWMVHTGAQELRQYDVSTLQRIAEAQALSVPPKPDSGPQKLNTPAFFNWSDTSSFSSMKSLPTLLILPEGQVNGKGAGRPELYLSGYGDNTRTTALVVCGTDQPVNKASFLPDAPDTRFVEMGYSMTTWSAEGQRWLIFTGLDSHGSTASVPVLVGGLWVFRRACPH